MRNHHLEVPFIAFYRKEYVQPELNINDLWRVYRFDEKVSEKQLHVEHKQEITLDFQAFRACIIPRWFSRRICELSGIRSS